MQCTNNSNTVCVRVCLLNAIELYKMVKMVLCYVYFTTTFFKKIICLFRKKKESKILSAIQIKSTGSSFVQDTWTSMKLNEGEGDIKDE